MHTLICPRCGASIPDDAPREPLGTPAGHHQTYRVPHRRPDGKGCAVVIAPVEEEEEGAG